MATYADPGVYVNVNNTPVVSTVGNGPINACIVGTAPAQLQQIDTSLFFKNNWALNILTKSNILNSSSSTGGVPSLTIKNSNSNTVTPTIALGTDYQIGQTTSSVSAPNNGNIPANSTYIGTGLTTLTTTGSPAAGTVSLALYVNGQPLLNSSNTQVTVSLAYNATASAISTAITNAIATGYIGGSATSLSLLNSAVTVTNPLGVSGTPTTIQFGSPITAITSSGSSSPYTWSFTANNNFAAGQTVTISGCTPTIYNGTWKVSSATSTQFTLTTTENPSILSSPGAGSSLTSNSLAITTTNSSGASIAQNIITFVATTSGLTTNTSIAATNTLNGSSVTATYNYSPLYGNKVLLFNNSNAVSQVYGNALKDDGSINSQISLAAQLAFANGAAQIYCLAVGTGASATDYTVAASPSAAQWQTAISYCLGGFNSVDTIVPLVDYNSTSISGSTWWVPSPQSWVTYFNTYTTGQAQNGTLQRFFLSRDTSASNPAGQASADALVTDAASFNNQRVSVFYPTFLQLPPTNSSSGTPLPVGGFYGAAAVAGVYAAQPGPQEPLTHKMVTGFYGINPTASVDDYMKMQGNGVLCLKQRTTDGSIYVRHGLTTNTSNWLTEEISIIAGQDQLYRLIKSNLINSGVIGSALTPNTASVIMSTVQSTLANAVSSNLIQGYANIQYQQSSTYPVSVTIQFQYSPTFPLNYINVSFSIDPTAGTVQFSTTTNAFNTTTGA